MQLFCSFGFIYAKSRFSHEVAHILPAHNKFLTVSKEEIKEEEEFINAEFKSVEQISDELITLSLLPNSRWQNLLSLDVIKVGTDI